MDPLLPGEIAIMVLRYLAANKCETAAMSLIEEMPILKSIVHRKPPNMSNSDYLKPLARPSVTPGLKDMLSDYGNSKMLADEILECDSLIMPSFASDSLHNKLKTIHELLKVPSPPNASGSIQNSTAPLTVAAIKFEQSTNGNKGSSWPRCASSRPGEEKTFVETGCQTEEFTAVQFGLQDEIPRMFYQSLLSDNDLQHKLAQTINEHIADSENGHDARIQEITSKTENEIDKFLGEFLQGIEGMPADAGDTNDFLLPLGNELYGAGGATNFTEVEGQMSTLFKDNNRLVGEGQNQDVAGSGSGGPFLPNMPVIENISLETPPANGPENNSKVIPVPLTPSLGCMDTTSPGPEPNTSLGEDGTELRKINEDSSTSLPGSLNSASTSRRPNSVKRITPTPIPSSVNPVFKTSVVVEKQTVDFGGKQTHVSVITKNIERPPWKKLGRMSITPKIPLTNSNSDRQQVEPKVRVVTKDATDKVITLRKPFTSCRSKEANNSKVVETGNIKPGAKTPEKGGDKATTSTATPPSSTKKRKTTPVKLSPEKASNDDYNFVMHFHSENGSRSSTVKMNEAEMNKASESVINSVNNELVKSSSIVKGSPVMVAVATGGEQQIDVANSDKDQGESEPVATPSQASLPLDLNFAGLKTISPNALTRLITSAGKLYGTSSQINSFIQKKKSFSTPRKRKHVRSLTFATPPSLKTGTKSGNDKNASSDPAYKGLKRKAVEDLFATDFRSKKRLNWPESEKNRNSENSLSLTGKNRSTSNPEITGNIPGVEEKPGLGTKSEAKDAICVAPSMPTILEESLSNISMVGVDEVQPSPNQNVQVSQVNTVPSTSASTPNRNKIEIQTILCDTGLGSKLMLYSIPTLLQDGTTQLQYYQLSPDMQTLIPVNIVESPAPHRTPAPLVPPPVMINSDGTVLAYLPPSEGAQFLSIPSQVPAAPGQFGATSVVSPVSTNVNASSRQPIPSSGLPLEQQAGTSMFVTPPQLPPSKQMTPIENSEVAAVVVPPELPSSDMLLSPLSLAINSVALGKFSPGYSKRNENIKNLGLDLSISSSSSSNESTPQNPEAQNTKTRRQARSPIKSSPIPPTPAPAPVVADASPPKKNKRGRSRQEPKSDSVVEKKVQQTRAAVQKKNKMEEQSMVGLPSLEINPKTNEPIKNIPLPIITPAATAELELPVPENTKKTKTRGKREAKPKPVKKPKLMFNSREIFGETPTKPKIIAHNTKTTPNKRLPPDVVAAQKVAADAVPLGTPRRSPRKHPAKSPSVNVKIPPKDPPVQKVFPIENHASESIPVSVPSINISPPELPRASTSSATSVSVPPRSLPPSAQKIFRIHDESTNMTSFSIVQGPEGFPEPTPMKNFAETGFLNLSAIIGSNNSLITPFKSYPPGGSLNETQFTIPPTPRMIEDHDSNSNSNSAHSLRLIYDGMIPLNLLTSTPMKPGLPRTPGRSVSSSNSHSPVLLHGSIPQPKSQPPPNTIQIQVQANAVKTVSDFNLNQPQSQHAPKTPTEPVIPKETTQTNTKPPEIRGAEAPAEIATPTTSSSSNKALHPEGVPPKSESGNKSEGEISSDEEKSNDSEKAYIIPSKPRTQMLKTLSPIPSQSPSLTIVSTSAKDITSVRKQALENARLERSQAAAQSKVPSQFIPQRKNDKPKVMPVHVQPQPQMSASVPPNIKKTPAIPFQVGGRGKQLSISEQETLITLLHLGTGNNRGKEGNANSEQVDSKKEAPNRPVGTASVIPQKPSETGLPKEPHDMLKGKNLSSLMRVLRQKYKPPPPESN